MHFPGKRKKQNPRDRLPENVNRAEMHAKKQLAEKNFMDSLPFLLQWGIRAAIVFLVILYLFLPVSRTNSVVVEGNEFLSDAYIQSAAGISSHGIFYLNIPFLKEASLENDPMIEDADISLEENRVIRITVTEKKPVGYRYEDTPVVLLGDNTTAPLKSEYLEIIAKVPYITGFTEEEQTRLLCKALNDVDQSIIESISEISQYALSYDDEAMKILMRNGGYFIGTYHNLDKLNQYYQIYDELNDKSKCIFASETTSYAFAQTCPWNDTGTKEYWTDSDGNIVKNTYGDDVVKNYYTDENGDWALDESGNRIPIPIDSNGTENADEDFLEHYKAGYYSTGKLVMPDGTE